MVEDETDFDGSTLISSITIMAVFIFLLGKCLSMMCILCHIDHGTVSSSSAFFLEYSRTFINYTFQVSLQSNSKICKFSRILLFG